MDRIQNAITAVILTMNEERNIGRCLAALSFCDEILVFDSGSTDKTVELAQGKARVVTRPFTNFGDQRNAAATHITTEWALWIDADEVVTPELAKSIRNAVASNKADGYWLHRFTHFAGKKVRYGSWGSDGVLRLLRTSKSRWSDSAVHEHAIVNGATARLSGELLHFSFRDVDHYIDKVTRYSKVWAQGRAAVGKRSGLLQLLFHPAWRFTRDFLLRLGFLDGSLGAVVCGLSAYNSFLKYAYLYQLTTGAPAAKPD
ncbi:MAG: glycosyltransferase family 2 protein [Candidatus Brocadiia bacterium]